MDIMTQTVCSIDTLQFETSTVCNAECSFCRHKDMSRSGQMPLHRIIDIIYNLAHKAKHVCPFWMQEPTLDNRMPQILSNIKCYAPKAETMLYSNMAYYPEQKWKTILQAGLLDNLIISFYGTDKPTYNKLQPPLDFEVTKANIKKLWKLRNKLGWNKPQIAIRLLVTPETMHKTNDYNQAWKPYCDYVGFTWLENWDTNNKDEVLEFNRKYWGEPAQRVPCARLYGSQNIQCNGDAVACCMDYNGELKLGNVFEDGYGVFTDNSELNRLKDLHEAGEWNQIPACKNCTIYAYNHSEDWIKYWLNQKSFVYSAISR